MATTRKSSSLRSASPRDYTYIREIAPMDEPKVITTPAKGKRPAKATPQDWTKGEVVLAHHPRKHRRVAEAVIVEDFNHEHSTYVRLQFRGSDDVILTHKFNVGIKV